ncbi:hypothetical protein H8356DRAFT_1351160 [Neocallimastix lanati (nom. inval.)]|nr:hypothetical protein H8356DRAFT_1351160 [Neocallimastix sp. JGI-2020a]
MTQCPYIMKIHYLGIRGKCYHFIENLYLSSKACVRVDGQLSESFNIKKEGVRQGFVINMGISIGDKCCCCGSASIGSQLKKLLLKFASKWAKNNENDIPGAICGVAIPKKYKRRKLTKSVNADNESIKILIHKEISIREFKYQRKLPQHEIYSHQQLITNRSLNRIGYSILYFSRVFDITVGIVLVVVFDINKNPLQPNRKSRVKSSQCQNHYGQIKKLLIITSPPPNTYITSYRPKKNLLLLLVFLLITDHNLININMKRNIRNNLNDYQDMSLFLGYKEWTYCLGKENNKYPFEKSLVINVKNCLFQSLYYSPTLKENIKRISLQNGKTRTSLIIYGDFIEIHLITLTNFERRTDNDKEFNNSNSKFKSFYSLRIIIVIAVQRDCRIVPIDNIYRERPPKGLKNRQKENGTKIINKHLNKNEFPKTGDVDFLKCKLTNQPHLSKNLKPIENFDLQKKQKQKQIVMKHCTEASEIMFAVRRARIVEKCQKNSQDKQLKNIYERRLRWEYEIKKILPQGSYMMIGSSIHLLVFETLTIFLPSYCGENVLIVYARDLYCYSSSLLLLFLVHHNSNC